MKNNPASIERNANASAQQNAPAFADAAENIFHSKLPATAPQPTKEEKTMNTKQRAAMYQQIKSHGKNLLAIFPNATERDPVKLCKKLRRLETAAQAIALRLCNGPEYANADEPDRACASILAKVNALLGNVHEYQPKTGARCTCRPGIARENCATCEGTGWVVDFSAIRNRLDLVPVFVNRDHRGYALKIEEEATRDLRDNGKPIHADWGGHGIIAPDFTPDEND